MKRGRGAVGDGVASFWPLALALTLLVGGGCSTVGHPRRISWPVAGEVTDGHLWTMELTAGGRERFTGLLATHLDGDGLHYVVLDPTGITLLRARLDHEGASHLEESLKPVRDTGLPKYLARAMERIFRAGPQDGECVRSGLIRFCDSSPNPHQRRREARAGPFLLWSVEYTLDASASTPATGSVHYAPWGRPRLHLEPLSQGGAESTDDSPHAR